MMSEGPSSPALAAPYNEDILREILLRLPPLPSSLPRASLVSKRWRRILSDPQFLRRFRAFHHRRAPLVGLFSIDKFGRPYFAPTLDPPNRIPSARLSLPLSLGESWRLLGCRHGLVLMLNLTSPEIIVWDPVTRDQRRVAVPQPQGLNSEDPLLAVCCGALLCDDHAGRLPLESFKVVLLWTNDVLLDADPRAFALLYESEAGVWSNTISTSIRAPLSLFKASILADNSLYWLLLGHGNSGILKFDLDRKNLTVINTPPKAHLSSQSESQILLMGDSRLGYAIVTGFSIQVWEKKPNSESRAKWMRHKTINLDKLLTLGPTMDRSSMVTQGYDEDGNAIFVSACMQVFMIKLKSLQLKSLFKSDTRILSIYHPFTAFYTTVDVQMSKGSTRRRQPFSPALAAPLPDNDDLLREILLRLPPLPSSLPRASLVSKHWRRILSDPQFVHRFRAFHHRRAPLLGFFTGEIQSPYFTPTLDPPDSIPSPRLSLSLPRNEGWRFLGCRHGLVLILNSTTLEVTMWDPITRDQQRVALPPGLKSADPRLAVRCGTLLCDDHAGRVPLESFKVVLLRTDDVLLNADPHVFAFLYESKADVWSNISTSIRDSGQLMSFKPGILVGKSLFWLLLGYGNSRILKFDLDRKNLTVIDTPPDARLPRQSQILRIEDSRLGFAIVTGFSIQVWEKQPNSEGGAKWCFIKPSIWTNSFHWDQRWIGPA